jgi:outer membrane protein assembly factor BamB
MFLRLSSVTAVILAGVGGICADDWTGFRGSSGNGVSAEKSVPTEWDATKNVKWKVALPYRGNGSPIVSNGRVLLTCPEDDGGKRRSLYCFDRKNGNKLWVATVDFGRETPTHDTNPHSSSTPVTDGKRIVVWHDTAGLYCYDVDGKELWKRNLGEFNHVWGGGTSPILYEGKVVLNSGPGKRVFVTALNLADGKTLWETEEPQNADDVSHNENAQWKGSWTTPVIAKVGGQDQILCTMPTRLVAYSPVDGKILWWCEGIRPGPGDVAYSSPVVVGDVAVIIAGYGGSGFGVKLGGQGNVTPTAQLWRREKFPQSIGSGVVVDGLVYTPFEGFIECIDPRTGKSAWRGRGSTFWSSAVLAGGKIYVTDQKGTTWVIKPNPEKLEVLAKNEIEKELTNGTPAISDGQIFIRTHKHLWCIGE